MCLTRTSVRPRNHHQSGDHRSRGINLGRGDTDSRAHAPACSSPHRPAGNSSPPPAAEARDGQSRSILRRVLLVAELVAVALLASGVSAHADTVVLAIADSVDQVLTNIRDWLMGILAALATVFLTIGGVRRVFGGADPGEQEKAKEAFKAAGIGYTLAALAPLVVSVLQGIVGA